VKKKKKEEKNNTIQYNVDEISPFVDLSNENFPLTLGERPINKVIGSRAIRGLERRARSRFGIIDPPLYTQKHMKQKQIIF
jgi:hypothetical protein